MARTCTICAHPERKAIDAMIASKQSFLQIATRFGLNNKTVTTHGHNCVEPVIESLEIQANKAVLERIMSYRDAVNLPLPEKSKYIENQLWADFEKATKATDRVNIAKAIREQQQEQARLSGAYVKDAPNPVDNLTMARRFVELAVSKGKDRGAAIEYAEQAYGVLASELIGT